MTKIDKTTESAAKLFRSLGEASRMGLLAALRDGPLPVNELVARTGLTQSNVSNHLACLRGCGLVVSEQQGRFVFYALSDPRIVDMMDLAAALADDTASGVKSCRMTPRMLAGRGASVKASKVAKAAKAKSGCC